jgi:hypothetical protein
MQKFLAMIAILACLACGDSMPSPKDVTDAAQAAADGARAVQETTAALCEKLAQLPDVDPAVARAKRACAKGLPLIQIAQAYVQKADEVIQEASEPTAQ